MIEKNHKIDILIYAPKRRAHYHKPKYAPENYTVITLFFGKISPPPPVDHLTNQSESAKHRAWALIGQYLTPNNVNKTEKQK